MATGKQIIRKLKKQGGFAETSTKQRRKLKLNPEFVRENKMRQTISDSTRKIYAELNKIHIAVDQYFIDGAVSDAKKAYRGKLPTLKGVPMKKGKS